MTAPADDLSIDLPLIDGYRQMSTGSLGALGFQSAGRLRDPWLRDHPVSSTLKAAR